MSSLYGDDYFMEYEIDPLVKSTSSRLYSLDIYNPQAREYIKKCLKHYMDMGFEFFNLSFKVSLNNL